MSVDVTGNQRARERLALLSEAGTRIGGTLDVMRTSREPADLAVPLLADYAAVDLAEFVPLGDEPAARTSPTGQPGPAFRRAGLASIHPGTLSTASPPGVLDASPRTAGSTLSEGPASHGATHGRPADATPTDRLQRRPRPTLLVRALVLSTRTAPNCFAPSGN
ncbi:hypothetical protein ACIOHS_14865 [Streptomyces sp. NPDC088253]|uniref:hypothetical protein n=1 Tax=Streptomyces sp. NPDC088253 TaxID=3365846 RepID=UPI0037F11537